LITFGYAKEVLFPIELDVNREMAVGRKVKVVVDVEWLVCQDVCLPAVKTLSLELPVTKLKDVKPTGDFNAIQNARSHVPRIDPHGPRFVESGPNASLTVPRWMGDREFVDFFPFKNSGVTNEAPIVKSGAHLLYLSMTKSNVPQADKDRVGVLITREKRTGQIEATQFGESGWTYSEGTPREPAGGLWWMILSALLGGLILNLMPCVFPILSIKLLSLLKLSEAHPNEVRAQNFAYVVGVMISFLAIALTLSLLRSAGHLVGWGFQLQSPIFLALLAWLFFLLSLNLFGLYEIDLVDVGFGNRLTKFGGLSGAFFTGVLAVVVASPCTAPFMGVALGFGLSQSTAVLIAIFLALGLGLAMPYLIFAVFPAWIRVLPKPGVWMTRVRQVMGFPLLLTDLWLMWILGQVRGPNAVIVVLLGCVVLGFCLWLARWRKHLAKAVAVLAMGFGVYYVYGLDRRALQVSSKNEMWQPYSPALMESLKGKNIFVNMTADWCLTCQVNERLVFSDPSVLKLLRDKKVEMLKGDWTERNRDITLFLNRFRRVGVPFYVLYSPQHPDGQPLPEVLTKSIFIEWIQKEFP
jgi:thiol:disulfide interchange protein DsbD